ncbi:cell division protein DivIVA [Mycobacterium vicinigordonae]|uniref:Cell division protein DivIVA n=1 Tax=Mycobacterium vicinigordonae TaxID=1719132 RepID=A0A7D6E908_9MYCO|nr:cell division protein DivIVA [Mycobacterium vicinigordonae]QLL09323.1 cell division protein DivIVA [Mycobacterium vicinigordonae]
MRTEPGKTFPRMFRGYDPAAVDARIEMLTTKEQLLRDDVESLRTRLKESADEAAALRAEVAVLAETSPSPHAVQHRMAKMMRRAVDEIAEMQAEARAEADALIESAQADIADEQRRHEEQLADMRAQREALATECEETREKLAAELAKLRAETQSTIDRDTHQAQQERDRLIEHARRVVDEAAERRISILEQLAGVHRDLESIPVTLEAAYRERDQEAGAVTPLDQKRRTG